MQSPGLLACFVPGCGELFHPMCAAIAGFACHLEFAKAKVRTTPAW